LQRDLGALLFFEHLLLRAAAFGDIDQRAFEAGDRARAVRHHAGILEHRDLRPVTAPHQALRVAYLALRADALGERGPVLRIPVQLRGVAQCIELLGARITEHFDERGIGRAESSRRIELVHALHQALVQPAVFRLAVAQRLFGGPQLVASVRVRDRMQWAHRAASLVVVLAIELVVVAADEFE
jgi:hypothetical protein